jgi:hypothetical protein
VGGVDKSQAPAGLSGRGLVTRRRPVRLLPGQFCQVLHLHLPMERTRSDDPGSTGTRPSYSTSNLMKSPTLLM